MKFVSWNVNGIRAALRHNFISTFKELDADIFGIQNIRVSQDEVTISFPHYYQYWNYSKRKGYAGTAVFTKQKPITVARGIGDPALDDEGRSITLEFPDFYYVDVQAPFSGERLQKLDLRESWAESFRKYAAKLIDNKPVVIGGDLGIAHEKIDVFKPEDKTKRPGFTPLEREDLTKLLEAGFTDTYRKLHPKEIGYTYWTYRDPMARKENLGWRLDYYLVSDNIAAKVKDSKILSSIHGSEHCPIELDIDIK